MALLQGGIIALDCPHHGELARPITELACVTEASFRIIASVAVGLAALAFVIQSG